MSSAQLPSGECSIADQFRTLFFEDFIPAQGVDFCSPVYWYGLSAQMKAFFDRTFCYYAASYPDSARVIDGMSRKRIGLVLASEETYPSASLGIVHQIQEFSCYTHSEFVGVVRGIGNSRGEVTRDQATRFLLRNSSAAKSLSASILTSESILSEVDGSGHPNPPMRDGIGGSRPPSPKQSSLADVGNGAALMTSDYAGTMTGTVANMTCGQIVD